LELEREVSNLVKKERSPIRNLEPPDGLIRSAGESSFFVTEELALQQSTRNGRTVERYKAVPAPRARLVNRTGNHFLAGASFSLNEDGGVHRRDQIDVIEQSAEFRAGSNQIQRSHRYVSFA
jgi:hypothetical protein